MSAPAKSKRVTLFPPRRHRWRFAAPAPGIWRRVCDRCGVYERCVGVDTKGGLASIYRTRDGTESRTLPPCLPRLP